LKNKNPTTVIQSYIQEHPGVHTSHIACELGFAWSTINYHVSKLIRQGKISWHTTSGRNGLYSSSLPEEMGHSMSVLMAPDRHDLLLHVHGNEGQSLSELLQSFKVSRKVLRKDLEHLENAGCIDRSGGHRGKYYITKHGLKTLDERAQAASLVAIEIETSSDANPMLDPRMDFRRQ
jgi:predicted transcriptional regulator